MKNQLASISAQLGGSAVDLMSPTFFDGYWDHIGQYDTKISLFQTTSQNDENYTKLDWTTRSLLYYQWRGQSMAARLKLRLTTLKMTGACEELVED